MFEDLTFDVILKRMMDQIPDNLDKREGGILYNALAPAAVEMQNMYIGLDWILDQSFVDTQSREYLIRRCAERGIDPREATHAVLKGEFNQDVPIGSRFSVGILNYQVAEKIGPGVYQMVCETVGEEGNRNLGTMIPIQYIRGLTRAELTAVLIPGEDEEGTEQLRKQYFDSLNAKAFGGNIQDYLIKTNALEGVGGVKVYPVWNGGGTVKLVLIDASYNRPSQALLDFVQAAVDPSEHPGEGVGLAPIGHVVTMEPVSEQTVNIALTVIYDQGWSWSSIKQYVESCVEEYLKELRSAWADSGNLVVRISQIESRLLELSGILDITATTLNGEATNFALGKNEIPVRGEIVDAQIT